MSGDWRQIAYRKRRRANPRCRPGFGAELDWSPGCHWLSVFVKTGPGSAIRLADSENRPAVHRGILRGGVSSTNPTTDQRQRQKVVRHETSRSDGRRRDFWGGAVILIVVGAAGGRGCLLDYPGAGERACAGLRSLALLAGGSRWVLAESRPLRLSTLFILYVWCLRCTWSA